MEPDEFRELVKSCPIRVRMNDGRDYLVEKPEFVIVGDYGAGILFRNEEGKLLNAAISLINISTVLTDVNLAGN